MSEPTREQVEMNDAKGELNVAEGKLKEAKGELKEAKGELKEAKGGLEKAKGELEKAKGELEKARTSGIKADIDDAVKAKTRAGSELDVAEDGLKTAQEGVKTAQKGVGAIQSRINSLTETVNELERRILERGFASMSLTAGAPSIDMKSRITESVKNEMTPEQAFSEDLPFRICTRARSVLQDHKYRAHFEYGECERVTNALDHFLEHKQHASSEYGVVETSGLWFTTFCNLVDGMGELRDSRDHLSSRLGKRPDGILIRRGAVVARMEEKASDQDLDLAQAEIVTKISADGHYSCPTSGFNVGLAVTRTKILILSIDYNLPIAKSKVLKSHDIEFPGDRPAFIIDLFKLARFFTSVRGPRIPGIWIPGHEVETSNSNRLIRVGDYLLKKQLVRPGFPCHAVKFDVIRKIYEAGLKYVERGEVRGDELKIVTIGVALHYIENQDFYDARDVIRDIGEAMKELHEIGVAHCDMRETNIVYLPVERRYILVDLEYCCGENDKCPEVKHKPKNQPELKPRELDEWQFDRLKEALLQGPYRSVL